MRNFLKLKTVMLALLFMLIGTFWLPIKSYPLSNFNITIYEPKPDVPQINKDGTMTYSICNPIGGPRIGKPFLFIDYKFTNNTCGHFTLFNPIGLVLNFIIYLILANLIIGLKVLFRKQGAHLE